jgi:hypothetical protein
MLKIPKIASETPNSISIALKTPPKDPLPLTPVFCLGTQRAAYAPGPAARGPESGSDRPACRRWGVLKGRLVGKWEKNGGKMVKKW